MSRFLRVTTFSAVLWMGSIAPAAAECARWAGCSSPDYVCVGQLFSEELMLSWTVPGSGGVLRCETHMCHYRMEDEGGFMRVWSDIQTDCGSVIPE